MRRSESIHALQAYLREGGIDAFLVTHLPHIRYLSGFTGSNAWLLVRKRSSILLTDPRYREQVQSEVLDLRTIIVAGKSLTEALVDEGLLRNAGVLGFETAHLPHATVANLKKVLRPLRLLPMYDAIEQLRENKYPDEVSAIQKAIRISETVWSEVLPLLRPGVTEIQIAAEITYRQRLLGADGDSFEPIVLFGKRSSLVHGQPSAAKLRAGQAILMDFGCRVKGYASDLTRTVFLGNASPRMRHIYLTVQNAQDIGRTSACAGMLASDLDGLVRGHIADEGYGSYFEHGLGHGLGLEVHERPLMSWRNKAALEHGMVVTIEPGIYIPGVGGVRIEDDILITENGAQTLSTLTRDLLEL
jgi:Xaa-Pro aminopeptidase